MTKNIEITGAFFQNKGSLLMLQAILDAFKDEDVRFLCDPTIGTYKERGALGLYQRFRVRPLEYDYTDPYSELVAEKNMQIDEELFENILNNHLGNKLGIIGPGMVDVILDMSGFRYSDQWGEEKTLRGEFLYRTWKKQGKKIILLPQSFGPFENTKIRNAFISIIENSELLYARDKQSYQYVMDICPDQFRYKIRESPDFTTLIQGARIDDFEMDNAVCIIPNYRMVDKTNSEVADWYIHILHSITLYLKRKQIPFYYLIHSTDGADAKLTEMLENKIGDKLTIIHEEDPIKIKGIISRSSYVIGSRFHGLVNALSNRIPAIGIGWSHKYKYLFDDFNCSHCLIDHLENEEHVLATLNRLFESDYNHLQTMLEESRAEYERKTISMWNEVKAVIWD